MLRAGGARSGVFPELRPATTEQQPHLMQRSGREPNQAIDYTNESTDRDRFKSQSTALL